MMILGTYSRSYMQTQEPFRQTVTQEALARNPIRFACLMDVYAPFPFGKNDVDAGRLMTNVNNGAVEMAPYRSLFDREPARDKVTLRPDYAYESFDREGWEAQRKARMARSPLRKQASEDE